ncbi:hypothetical protein [Stutzerimonas kunmingensis]|uniref:hypothetical protein n=1 Tax=Stutzerimonas kunmingensis TaxID=1211807 RepID=UPI00241C1A6D|nr:hypothetical protein [Stutzerimonas kunmingensis]
MSKLLKLKEWLSTEEAADRLSISVGESITEADILRLALDGHLTLSVYFVNHAKGRPFRIEPLDKANVLEAVRSYAEGRPVMCDQIEQLNEFVLTYRGDLLPNGEELMVLEGNDNEYKKLEGVWDLLMLGAEKLDVEHLYQNLTGGPDIELVCLGGPLVTSPDRSQCFQILSSYNVDTRHKGPNPPIARPKISKKMRESLDWMNSILGPVTVTPPKEEEPPRWDYETFYCPAAGLPEGSVFVVRTSALRELEGKLLADEAPPEKPLHPSERRSAGQIISALAAMAGLDLSAPYAADETLRADAATRGLELPSSSETVVKFFKSAITRIGKA